MGLETSAESPAPLRQVATLLGGWIDRLSPVWVEAEVAQLQRRSGVCFLTLRDLRATLSANATCHSSILDSSPAPVVEGSRVVVNAKPTYYLPTGRLSLEIREIRPAGEGELLAQLERRKQLLAAEGLFDPRRKRPLPFLPRAVGLVTGRGSAAERDVLENARLRWPGVEFVVRHALVQGAGAASEVTGAVQALASGGQVDVIVVARGGGSVEDLLPFSDEGLLRAVAACTVPVVSAIGHEPDTPLLDLVADVRASTPTDAAKRVVPDAAEEAARVAHARDRLARAVEGLIEREEHRLEQLRSRPVLAAPHAMIDAQAERVDDLRSRAARALGHRIDRDRDTVDHQLARVRALSPLATLRRGYAVAQAPDGTPLTSVHDAPAAFGVRLADGTVHVDRRSIEETRHEQSD